MLPSLPLLLLALLVQHVSAPMSDYKSMPVVIRGSYSDNIKMTGGLLPLSNISQFSADDFNRTVRTLQATHQNLYGFRVGDCASLASLPDLMRAVDLVDPGGELRIFAWLGSHEGHGSELYCDQYVDAAGDVNWTLVASVLAKLSLQWPRLVAYNIDDFFVTMAQPCGDAAACGQEHLPSGKPLKPSAIKAAYDAMRAINPKFKFWPAIYFQQLGLAFDGGFIFGATQGVPFDNQTSASLHMSYTGPPLPTARLSFRYTCMYCRQAGGDEWTGVLFLSVTACGKQVLLVDMLSLEGASAVSASGVSSFDANISLTCGGVGKSQAATVDFRLFSPKPLNDNFFVHKIANIFLLSLKETAAGKELVGTSWIAFSMSAQSSPHPCATPSVCNFTNAGKLITQRSETYAVSDYIDGALLPFSHRPLDFEATKYKRLMLDARQLLPRPKMMIVDHYARNGLLDDAPFDPATLHQELEIDLKSGVADGAAVWSMPLAIGDIDTQSGIFSQHRLLPNKPKRGQSTPPAKLLTYFPHGQTGYFGWYQRFVSRQQLPATAATNTLAPPASNVLTVSFKHSAQKGTIPAPQDAIFTKTVYLRSHQSARLPAAVFYFGAAQGRACAVTGNYPCPGEAINTSVVGVGNASCVLRCNASQPGTETLLLTVPQPGTLVLEMNENKGVGNYQSYVTWTPPGGLDRGDDDWKFESGVADAGTVLMHDAIVDAYSEPAEDSHSTGQHPDKLPAGALLPMADYKYQPSQPVPWKSDDELIGATAASPPLVLAPGLDDASGAAEKADESAMEAPSCPSPVAAAPTIVVKCNDRSDCTTDIQAAMDSHASTVTIPSVPQSTWIVQPLLLRANQRVILEPGVTLHAKTGSFHGKLDSIFSTIHPREPQYRVCNSVVIGYGAQLVMNQAEYINTDNYSRAEWRSGITLDAVVNVSVLGLKISRTGGDGIMVLGNGRSSWSENVVLADLTVDSAYRNALSVISVVNLTVSNCTLSYAGKELGTRPMAGIDFEPDHMDQRLSQITVKNCTMTGNKGQGISVTLPQLNGSSFPVSITVDDCDFEDNTWGYRVLAGGNQSGGQGPPPAGVIQLTNSRITGSQLAAVDIGGMTTSSAVVKILNVTISGSPSLRQSSGAVLSPECRQWSHDWCAADGECQWINSSLNCWSKKMDTHGNTSAIIIYSSGAVAETQPLPPRPHAIELDLDLNVNGAIGPELWDWQSLVGVYAKGSPNWAPVHGEIRLHTTAIDDCAKAVKGAGANLTVKCIGLDKSDRRWKSDDTSSSTSGNEINSTPSGFEQINVTIPIPHFRYLSFYDRYTVDTTLPAPPLTSAYANMYSDRNLTNLVDIFERTGLPGLFVLEESPWWLKMRSGHAHTASALLPGWQVHLDQAAQAILAAPKGAVRGVMLGDELVCMGLPLSNLSAVATRLKSKLATRENGSIFIYTNECFIYPYKYAGSKWANQCDPQKNGTDCPVKNKITQIPGQQNECTRDGVCMDRVWPSIPSAIDFVSLDRYWTDRCDGNQSLDPQCNATDDVVNEVYNVMPEVEHYLAPLLQPHQKLWGVPGMFGPASARAPTSARKAYDELLVQQLNNWVRVIGKDERFVGLMPWHWPNLPTNIAPKYQLGAVAFTRLLEGVAAIKPPSLKSDDDDPVVVFVSPQGSDANAGTKDQPVRSVAAARDLVRAKRTSHPAVNATVWLRGGTYDMTLNGSLELDSRDSNTTWAAFEFEPVLLSGGFHVPKSQWGVPSTLVLQSLPSKTAHLVRQVDFTTILAGASMGHIAGAGPAGSSPPWGVCANSQNRELFFRDHNHKLYTPGVLARYPNVMANGTWNWSTVGAPCSTGPTCQTNFTAGQLSITRLQRWSQETDLWLQTYFEWDWANALVKVMSVEPASQQIRISPDTCAQHTPAPGNRWLAINALSELSTEGEYYLLRNESKALFIPPSDADELVLTDALTIVAGISNATLPLQNVQFKGVSMQFARGTAVTCLACYGFTIYDATLANIGEQAVEIDGYLCGLQNVTVSGTGCIGVAVRGGDTASLTPGRSFVRGSTIANASRWHRTYTPHIHIGGVGNTYSNNNVLNGPHSAMVGGCNDCTIDRNIFKHFIHETADAGAFYDGRTWVHRGNMLSNNLFSDIRHSDPQRNLKGGMAAACYFDDMLSGNFVINNTFIDCETGVLIGGGRHHIVQGNTFHNVGNAGGGQSVWIDARGLNGKGGPAANPFCRFNGTFHRELMAVKFDEPPWASHYPSIPPIFASAVHYSGCEPANNRVMNNTCTGDPASPGRFLVTSPDMGHPVHIMESWGDTFGTNLNGSGCVLQS